jgi:hypothetical protein
MNESDARSPRIELMHVPCHRSNSTDTPHFPSNFGTFGISQLSRRMGTRYKRPLLIAASALLTAYPKTTNGNRTVS